MLLIMRKFKSLNEKFINVWIELNFLFSLLNYNCLEWALPFFSLVFYSLNMELGLKYSHISYGLLICLHFYFT